MSGLYDFFTKLATGQLSPEKQQALEEGDVAQQDPSFQPGLRYAPVPEMKRAESIRDAAIPRMATTVPELLSVVGQAIDTSSVPKVDDDGKPVGLIERFGKAKWGPDGYKNIESAIVDHVHDAMANGDTRDPKVIADAFSKSPEFEQISQSLMPAFRRGVEKTTNAIDRSFGAPIDAEKTLNETIQTGVGQSMVPTTFVSKLAGGSKLAEFGLDMALPGTSRYTNKGLALNVGLSAAVPVAVDRAIEYFHPDKGDTVEDEQDEVPPPEERSSMLQRMLPSFSEAGLMGMAIAAAKKPGQAFAAGADAAVTRMTQRAGKQFFEFGPKNVKVGETSSKLNAAVDELAPAQAALKEAYDSTAVAYEGAREMSKHIRSNASASVEHWRNHGHLEGMDKPVLSGNKLEETRREMQARGDYDDFNKWALAETELDSRNAHLVRNLQQSNELSKRADFLRKNGRFAEESHVQKELAKTQQDISGILADTGPQYRHAFEDMSTKDLEAMSAQGRQNKEWVQLKDGVLQKHTDDVLEYFRRNGVLSDETIKSYKAANPRYMPLMNDPYRGATGITRVKEQLGKILSHKENPYAETDEFIKSFTPFQSRKFDNASKVNNPINVFDALDLYTERAVRYVNREKMKSTFIDKLNASGNMNKVAKQFTWNGRTQFSVNEVKHITKTVDLEDHVSRLVNGKVEFYKFHDPLVKSALQQGPTSVIPIASQVSKVFRQFTTGTMAPGFAPKSFGYDTKTINATRPLDTLYGLDYLVNKATLGKSPKWLENAARVAATHYDPTAHVLNMGSALTSYFKQNGWRLAEKMTEDLANSSGIFGQIAKVPGGQQWLTHISHTMADAFQRSLYNAAVHEHAATAAALENVFHHKREVDKFFNARVPKIAMTVATPLTEAVMQYRIMMSSVHSAARVGYIMRNAERLRGANGKIPPAAMKKLMTEARTLAGDFSRKPGSPALQMLDSASPWFNVMLRSSQNLWQRVVKDPKIMGMMLTGVVMPRLYTDYVMSNWDDAAYDYWYKQMPDWQRTSTIVFPRPEVIWEWAHGRSVPFSPDKLYIQTVVPEFRAFAEAMSQGMRALGFTGRVDPSMPQTTAMALSAVGEGAKQAFAPVTPPVIAGLAKPMGVNIDAGNVFQLPAVAAGAPASKANPFQPPTGAASRQGEGLNATSDIHGGFAEAVGALFGTTATRITQAFDTGFKTYDDTHSLLDAMMSGGKELAQRSAELSEDVPLVGSASRRVYRGSPVSNHAADMRKALGVVFGQNAQIKKFDAVDPTLDGVAWELRLLARSFEYKQFGKTFRENNDLAKQIEANRKIPYGERQKKLNEVRQRMFEMDKQQDQYLMNIQKDIANQYGAMYKQRFGVDFSLQDFARRIVTMKNKKAGY